MDRGGDSINNLLNWVVFSIAPTLIDIAIAIIYFTSQFGSYFGIIVFITMGGYIYFTITVTEWRTKFRREMNTRDNAVRRVLALATAHLNPLSREYIPANRNGCVSVTYLMEFAL